MGGPCSSLLQLVRASEVNIAATTHMGNWLSMGPQAAKIEVSATFLFHKFRLYDLDPVIYKEFANFDTLLDDAHAPTRIHTGPSFLKLLIANPEVAEAAGYPELSMAIIRRSLPDTMRLARTADKTGPSGRDHWLWAPELALGWPQGLQFLAAQGFNVLRGLRLAALSDDYESASILLTTEAPIFSNCNLNTSALYDDLICELAIIDNKVHLQMYAQELWRRGAEMRDLASGHLKLAEVNELGLWEDSAWFGRLEVLRLLSQKAEFPHKLMDALAILPHYVLAHEMGDESLSVHEILYKIGWTDVDAGYEHGRTPLIELCRHLPGFPHKLKS
ncbi:hypothetical protein KJ359_009963 [Pestalotiopsis sp. 9143b]|nr:hypothetical protein KJ359_009963 [Pestalotiopsis sp. 9143b]